MQRPERSVYTPADFIQWRTTESVILTPKFQRRGVWKPAARSFFLDTLLRGMPSPPIYIRFVQSTTRDKLIREVIDGQQRVAAVLDFVDGQYRLSRSLQQPWAGKFFEQLSKKQQDQIKRYSFSAEVFHGISDLEVLEVFSRLNTYSVSLNAQELRNGKYFGFFKQAAYGLAHEHLEFWRRHGAFSERNIARMLEVEFVSEVVIAFLAGMQDKKKSIDTFYNDYDDEFKKRSQVEKRFRDVADRVNDALGDTLKETEFRRSPLLYTLFCVLYHRQYRMRGIELSSPRKAPSKNELVRLNEAVHQLSEQIERGRARKAVATRYAAFVNACLTQTDNIKPRQERFRALYRGAFR